MSWWETTDINILGAKDSYIPDGRVMAESGERQGVGNPDFNLDRLSHSGRGTTVNSPVVRFLAIAIT